MNRLRYAQATGRIFIVTGSDATEKLERIGVGYSGHPPYVNKPEAEALKAAGPLPRGSYRVRLLGHHVRLGPQVLFLEPLEPAKLHGRSGFLIHGDNEHGNHTASHGCIILPRKTRDRITQLLPANLEVV